MASGVVFFTYRVSGGAETSVDGDGYKFTSRRLPNLPKFSLGGRGAYS
jgi:hypothetical protein